MNFLDATPQRSLRINVEGLPPGPTPLVLLIPMQSDREPQIADLELSQAGASSLVVRFADVVPGDYMVAFEPLEQAET